YHVIRESLKLSVNEAEAVTKLFEFAPLVDQFIKKIPSSDLSISDHGVCQFRQELGMFLRRFHKSLPVHMPIHYDVLLAQSAIINYMKND
ncbi:hypothetical protein, partial [Klebsiella pneumoniae]|uniref:hypothetical protein n=1 Tax=Klebsiella pneumoniae TaxID=573 RepID=UPI0025A11D74